MNPSFALFKLLHYYSRQPDGQPHGQGRAGIRQGGRASGQAAGEIITKAKAKLS